jgi:hypothetical protein
MPKPHPPTGKPRPAIADLLHVPKSYKMDERHEFLPNDHMMARCVHCGKLSSDHGALFPADEGKQMCPPEFDLVNESGETVLLPEAVYVESKPGHTRDQLIAMIGKAYPEFVDLVKELELAKAEREEAKRAALRLYMLITRTEDISPDGIESCDAIIGRLRQCYDVIKNIALYVVDGMRAIEIATKHYQRISPVVEGAVLVNEKDNGPKLVTLPPGNQSN